MSGGLIDDLLKSARYARMIDGRTWEAVRQAFPDSVFDQWSDGLSRIASGVDDPEASAQFARGSAAVAQAHGTDLAFATVPAALSIAKTAGLDAASAFLASLPAAAQLFRNMRLSGSGSGRSRKAPIWRRSRSWPSSRPRSLGG